MAVEIHFDFPLKNGMHARPASRFQEVAGSYRSGITFVNRRTGTRANSKSTLSLVASATRQGDPCTLIIEGEDEEEASRGMHRFLTDEFPGCDEDLVIPQEPGLSRALPRALRGENLRIEIGISASGGIARAPAFLLSRSVPGPPPGGWPHGTAEDEVARVRAAVRDVQADMRERVASAPRGVERDILRAHMSIASDPEFTGSVEETLRTGHCSAGEALLETARRFAGSLSASGSVYLRERVVDIEDVVSRLIAALYGTPDGAPPVRITEDAVCVAESLAPSDLIALDRRHVRALVLSRGGVTSHTAILARAFAIPCVTGIPGIHRTVRQAEDLIVDADRALVVLAPCERIGRFYDRESRKLAAMRESLKRHADLPGISADGKRIEIAANAASLEEVGAAFAGGAEGIGLFRTEMLFMGKEELPGEEEQYAVYAEIAKCAAGRPVIIRTLDIGGDKPLPSLRIPPEENPFLGYRAIRLYPEYPALIRAQLRAILRASAHGRLSVMFPMVCSLHEVRAMKQILQELMNELDAAGTAFDRRIPVGIMVEIPSAAFILDQLAREVDFFSIGSNDLTQYFLAVDRTNRNVASLYTPFHPSFLRLLKQIIDGAHRHGKWIGLCGEMGGSTLAVPLFLGYGIDEISLAPSLIPAVKDVVRRCSVPDCAALLSSVTEMEGPGEVETALRGFAAALRGSALVTEDLVRLSSPGTSKEEAIRELIDMLHAAARVDDPDAVEDAVWLREETYPTALGYGVAIPHCKSPGVAVTSIAVLKLDAPVFWKMPDQDPVQFLILIVVAASAKGDEHLKIIAGLARRLVHDEFRRELMDATAPREVVDLLEH